MDADQEKAVKVVMDGHNLSLLGQAGTGKTFAIKECVNRLRAARKMVSLTCYTGIAYLQYQGMGPNTLHRFAGLEDGRHTNETLLHLIQTDERFSEAKTRILSTDVLIIDEISMVSQKIFESVEFVCRKLRGNGLLGEIQIVVCGDFYQLPPIKDELYNDDGHYCIQPPLFKQLFPHIMELSTIHRQSDNELINCINELEKGIPSPETNRFMYNLSRPLSPENDAKAVRLFARNVDVDIYNYQRLQELDNPLPVMKANLAACCRFLVSYYASLLNISRRFSWILSIKSSFK